MKQCIHGKPEKYCIHCWKRDQEIKGALCDWHKNIEGGLHCEYCCPHCTNAGILPLEAYQTAGTMPINYKGMEEPA